jgi:hypothetical protein
MRKACLLLMCLVAATSPVSRPAMADTPNSLEYKVKAAFLYNFIKFIEWPDVPDLDVSNTPITIGILGEDKFGPAFDEITTRKVRDRSIAIKRFADFGAQDAQDGLSKCQLVFVSASQRQYTKEIIALLNKKPILVVGENEGFLEAGGTINFIMQDNKVCFEINADRADETNLKIAAQLLKLAKRVIKGEKSRSSSATWLLSRQGRDA